MTAEYLGDHIPKPFQEALSELYAGKLEPLNRRADDLNVLAHQLLLKYAVWGKTAIGQRIYSTDLRQIDGEIEGQEVRYSLMAERTLHLDDKYIRTWRRAITLAINGDFYQPAALFVPPATKLASAAIVVGSHINEDQHLEELQGILNTMESTWDMSQPVSEGS